MLPVVVIGLGKVHGWLCHITCLYQPMNIVVVVVVDDDDDDDRDDDYDDDDVDESSLSLGLYISASLALGQN